MILTTCGTKGGGGKSTVATNLACIAAAQYRVLLVDADDQATSADFSAVRRQDHPDLPQYTCVKLSGKSVRTEVLAMAPQYDHVIIDTGGRDTTSQRAALSVANLALIPFAPRSFDMWTVETIAGIVEEMRTVNPGLMAWAFLNRTDPKGQGTENIEAAEFLAKIPALQFIDCPLGNLKAFAHAATQGLSVVELKKGHPTASGQISLLFDECFAAAAEVEGAANHAAA